jgi:hypothetical protein
MSLNALSKVINFEKFFAEQALPLAFRVLGNPAVARSVVAVAAALSFGAVAARAQNAFVIQSVNSGLVLDVPGLSTQQGTYIWQWSENHGLNQQWLLKSKEAGYVIEPLSGLLGSSASPLVLDVPGFSTQEGTQIWQWPETDASNQLWTLNAKESNTYEIVSVNSGLVLDVPEFSTRAGTRIQQWAENGGPNQQWTFAGGNSSISITVTGQTNQSGAWITVTGQNFVPGYAVQIRYMGVPGRKSPLAAGTANVAANGTFTSTNLVYFTSGNINDSFGFVTVVAEVQGYVNAIAQVSASYWVY